MSTAKDYKDSIMDMAKKLGIEDFAKERIEDIEAEVEEVKEPVIGEFKTKDKFIQFIGAKGNINFISEEAFIDGKHLSGLGLDDVKFKLTLCDEGTVNFEEVDTNFTTKEQRQRLLEVISEKTIVMARNKMMIINELPFMSVKTINDKQIPLYLAVEYQKPIEKLASLFDDEEIVISDEQSSKLDDLLSMFDDEEPTLSQVLFESESDEELAREFEGENDNVTETIEPVYCHNKQMEEAFAKMKQDKIEDLTKRLDNKIKELAKFNQDVKLSTKKVNDTEDEIKLLESRLESLQPDVEFTGYYFNVSERLNEKINLDPEIADLIKSKISKIKSINVNAFMRLFEDGEYQIRIGEESLGVVVEVTDYQNLSETAKKALSKIGVNLIDNKLIYTGELNWGDIVNKLTKSGFAQDSEFDKKCGSNSYIMKTSDSQDTTSKVEDSISSIEITPTEIQSKTLKSFSEPTDFVILGCDYNGRDIEITDDYTNFLIKIGSKTIFNIESEGFVSILSIDKYKKWLEEQVYRDDCGAVLVSGYQGDIKVGAKLEDGTFTNEFDFSDYIHHQLEDCVDVFISFPEGTSVHEITDHNLSKVLPYIRDQKINSIIK